LDNCFDIQLQSTGCASAVFATGRCYPRLPAPIAYQTSDHLHSISQHWFASFTLFPKSLVDAPPVCTAMTKALALFLLFLAKIRKLMRYHCSFHKTMLK